MRYEVEVNGRLKEVNVHRENGRFMVSVGGRQHTVDAVRLNPHTLSLLIAEQIEPAAAAAADITRSYEVSLTPSGSNGQLNVQVGAAPLSVALNGRRSWGRRDDAALNLSGPQRIVAPMPGKVVRVLVKAGEAVVARQAVVVIEAMKMENELRAPAGGIVSEMSVRDGQSVDAGTLLAVIAPGATP